MPHRPHDGKQLNLSIIVRALEVGYGLSGPLAYFLVVRGIALLRQVRSFGLNSLARHNRIKHDASLVHDDTNQDEYAPILPNAPLVEQLMEEVKDGQFVTVEDIARVCV